MALNSYSLLPYLVRQTDESKSTLACSAGMGWIQKWELELDYLVVRHTHEHKSGSACREWEESAQIQVFMPMWDELDQNLGGEIGLPGSQTDTRAQNREGGKGQHKSRFSRRMG
jgi:hypothetical protein